MRSWVGAPLRAWKGWQGVASTHALAQATMKVFETRAPRRGIGEAEKEKKQKRVRLKRNRYHYMLLGRKDRGPSPVHSS